MTVRVAVTGATGRMGREVIGVARDRDDVEVVAAVNRDPDDETVDGVAVHDADELDELLEDTEAQVLVDFTGPESAAAYADLCARHGVAFVSGTTGLDDDHRAALASASESVPVLHAANFSRGIVALREAVGVLASRLDEYDVEVMETHHNGKRDAPSGTANEILSSIDEARGERAPRVHGREGEAPRSAGEIGVHAVRAGSVTGEHEVLLAGNDEEVRLTHRVGDRATFAEGAVEAGVWLVAQDPGSYEFSEVGR